MDGGSLPRSAPGARHEAICDLLHALMTASVANLAAIRLLASREQVRITRKTTLCPDLALVTAIRSGDQGAMNGGVRLRR